MENCSENGIETQIVQAEVPSLLLPLMEFECGSSGKKTVAAEERSLTTPRTRDLEAVQNASQSLFKVINYCRHSSAAEGLNKLSSSYIDSERHELQNFHKEDHEYEDVTTPIEVLLLSEDRGLNISEYHRNPQISQGPAGNHRIPRISQDSQLISLEPVAKGTTHSVPLDIATVLTDTPTIALTNTPTIALGAHSSTVVKQSSCSGIDQPHPSYGIRSSRMSCPGGNNRPHPPYGGNGNSRSHVTYSRRLHKTGQQHCLPEELPWKGGNPAPPTAPPLQQHSSRIGDVEGYMTITTATGQPGTATGQLSQANNTGYTSIRNQSGDNSDYVCFEEKSLWSSAAAATRSPSRISSGISSPKSAGSFESVFDSGIAGSFQSGASKSRNYSDTTSGIGSPNSPQTNNSNKFTFSKPLPASYNTSPPYIKPPQTHHEEHIATDTRRLSTNSLCGPPLLPRLQSCQPKQRKTSYDSHLLQTAGGGLTSPSLHGLTSPSSMHSFCSSSSLSSPRYSTPPPPPVFPSTTINTSCSRSSLNYNKSSAGQQQYYTVPSLLSHAKSTTTASEQYHCPPLAQDTHEQGKSTAEYKQLSRSNSTASESYSIGSNTSSLEELAASLSISDRERTNYNNYLLFDDS